VPGVRAAMVAKQRELARGSDTVLEGRDIGTVVFPDADVKVFLTASAEERARRRLKDMRDRGVDTSADRVEESLVRRDGLDSSRADSPLVAAADAVELDTTGLTVDDVVERVVALVEAR
jgi:cytidylate kinase